MKRIIAIHILLFIFGLITCALIIERSTSASAAMVAQGQPFFSIDSIEVTEGPNAQAVFTVRLTYQGGFRDFASSVDYSTSNGTATAPGDYQQSSGTVNFPPGQINSMTISIPIADDSEAEGAETFTVTLSNPQPAFVIEGPGTCTIRDNDGETRPCVAVFPEGEYFNGDGGTGTISIFNLLSSDMGCRTWGASLSSGSSFITLTSPTEGTFTGSVSYRVEPNTTSSNRSGAIRIHKNGISGPVEQTVEITQGPIIGQCTASDYILDEPSSIVMRDRPESDSGIRLSFGFTVRHPPTCAVPLSTNVNWLSCQTNPQSGSTIIGCFVENNWGPFRYGIVTAAGKQFTVYQNAADCAMEFACFFYAARCGSEARRTLELSRDFRDRNLSRTPRGQRYTELYYKFSSEAVQVMLLNPMLILRSREMITRYKPVLEALVKGEPVTLTEGDIDEIDSFLGSFASKGSPALKETIEGLRTELHDPQMHAEFDIKLIRGPKRESSDGGQLQDVKQMGGLWLLLGTAAYGLTGRRRKWLSRQARPLIVIGLVLSAVTTGFVMPAAGITSVAYSPAQLPLAAPQLSQSTYLGGGGTDEGNSIAVDAAGNTYVTGFTDSINFPLANAAQSNFGGGQQDAFVAKFNPAGALVYSTYLGGDGQDNATSIAVDQAGNAYITGYTSSKNFPTRNALQSVNRGRFNSFAAKLDPSGALVYSTYLGGSLNDHASSMAVDSSGNIYIAGITTSQDFPLASALQTSPGGSADLFVAKLNAAGTRLIYSTYLGGAGTDGASSLAVDREGNVYLTGVTSSPNFPTAGPLQNRLGGFFDAFAAKLNPAGNQLVYSTYLGGDGEDRALRISLDDAGNAYVTGDTDSADFPTRNAAQAAIGGGSDAFVTKISVSGNQIVYSTYLGGTGLDGGAAIAVDGAGQTVVTGFTSSVNFPTAAPAQPALGGGYDGFVARLTSSGAALDYSTYLGGAGIDSAFGVAADSGGNVYVMGVSDSTNFPTEKPFQQTYGGGSSDLFVASIKAGPVITAAAIKGKHLDITGSGFDQGAVILLDGRQQKTVFTSGTSLRGKKVGKKIAVGQSVTLQVRNSDGSLSQGFNYTR